MHRLRALALLAGIGLALAPRAAAAQLLCEAEVSITAPGLAPFIELQRTARRVQHVRQPFYDEGIPLTFPVVIGEASRLALELSTSVGRNPISTDPGTADIDFGSTARWGGIEEVTVDGNPVSYTIASESGTDWVQPVPEPGAAALLAAGAGVLAAARVRPRRTPRSRRPR